MYGCKLAFVPLEPVESTVTEPAGVPAETEDSVGDKGVPVPPPSPEVPL